MTLLTREGDGEQGRFANAPDVQRFLVKDGERYAGPWILFTKPRWAAFGELGERLRGARRTGSAHTTELHGRRRAALPRRHLFDRHGRGPPVQPQRRPQPAAS